QELGREPSVDGRGCIPVRERKLTLMLNILDDLPHGKVTAADWKVEGLGKGTFKEAGDREWSVDLSSLPWKRGEFRIAAKMATEAGGARGYPAKGLTLAYQPPAPAVMPRGEKHLTVDEALFTLMASVKPGVEGQALKVSLLHQHDNKDILNEELKAEELPAVRKQLVLKPGHNLIKLVVV